MRPYHHDGINIVNSGMHMVLLWVAAIQIIDVIRNNAADDILLWILIGGCVPAFIVGILLSLYHNNRYKPTRWTMKCARNSGESNNYTMVTVKALPLFLYVPNN